MGGLTPSAARCLAQDLKGSQPKIDLGAVISFGMVFCSAGIEQVGGPEPGRQDNQDHLGPKHRPFGGGSVILSVARRALQVQFSKMILRY